MKAKTRHWFIYQQPCFRFHIFAIHLIGVRIMPPCGARQCHAVRALRNHLFQSTRPMRGATQDGVIYDSWNSEFQSTRPARGATPRLPREMRTSRYFNPRAPRGARHADGSFVPDANGISIHAPREGRDMQTAALSRTPTAFQSTRPARGATASPRSASRP